MSRKSARRHAFHLIYQIPFNVPLDQNTFAELKAGYYNFVAGDLSDVDGLVGLSVPKGRDARYVDKAVWGVYEKQDELDGVIEKFLIGWTIDRLSRVDLALLRLSIYEMLVLHDVPPGVAVNEAVNLAKEYGTDESPAFINGILGKITKEIVEHA